MPTVRNVVDEATSIIGEVVGAGTEAYTDDVMRLDAIRSFNLLFTKYPWEQFRAWRQVTLDGVTGRMTAASDNVFANVRDFHDFLAIHLNNRPDPLPILPKAINPFGIGASTYPRYWTSVPVTDAGFEAKRLQIYPLNATGVVNVFTREYPIARSKDWDWSNEMYLDKDMLAAGAAFFSLSRDDTSASAADLQRNIMEMRFRDIMDALSRQERVVAGSGSPLPSQWFSPA